MGHTYCFLNYVRMCRFLRPLTYGHYPTVMQKDVNVRLPEFTEEESEKLKKSLDFVGLNYYGAFFTTPLTNINASELSYTNDVGAKLSGAFFPFSSL